MKRLIIEINYDDQAGLLSALNTIKGRVLPKGEFRSVRAGYSATGYLYIDEPAPKVINGQICQIIPSKMNVK